MGTFDFIERIPIWPLMLLDIARHPPCVPCVDGSDVWLPDRRPVSPAARRRACLGGRIKTRLVQSFDRASKEAPEKTFW